MNTIANIHYKINDSIITDLLKFNKLNSIKINLINYNTQIKFIEEESDVRSITSYYILIHLIISSAISEYDPNILESKFFNKIKTNFIHITLLRYLNENVSNINSERKHYLISCNDIHYCIEKDIITVIRSYLREKLEIENNIFFIIERLTEVQFVSYESIDDKFEVKIDQEEKTLGKTYTPQPVIEFMYQISNSSGILTNNNELTVLEPSCGSGLFLFGLIQYLINEKRISEDFTLIVDAFDVDYKALLTANTWLFILYIIKKLKVPNIEINFIHDNFLILNSINKKYSLIIGNPPYISERGFNKKFRRFLEENFNTLVGKADLFFVFIEKCVQYLDGVLCFIVPRYWIESEFGKNLRFFVKNNTHIELLIDFQDYRIFENVGVHSCIIKLKNKSKFPQKTKIIKTISLRQRSMTDLLNKISQIIYKKDHQFDGIKTLIINQNDLESKWIFLNEREREMFSKIKNHKDVLKLSEIALINEGINSGADKVSNSHILKYSRVLDPSINKGQGIFVLSSQELKNLSLSLNEMNFIKKWVKGSNIDRWIIQGNEHWIIYFHKDEILKSKKIYSHLSKFKVILENRAEIKRNPKRNWYELAWPRDFTIFERTTPKLLFHYKSKIPKVAIDYDGSFTSADFRLINVKQGYNPIIICCILNSNLIKYYLEIVTKKLGKIKDYYTYTIKDIPVVYPGKSTEQILLHYVKEIMDILKSKNHLEGRLKSIEQKIDKLIYKMYNLTGEDISFLS